MAEQAVVVPKRTVVYRRVYFCDDVSPRDVKHRLAIRDPECPGHSGALLIDDGHNSGRTTVLCMVSLRAWNVPSDCSEVAGAKEAPGVTEERFLAQLDKRYRELASRGGRADFEVAATALSHFGRPVPDVEVVRPEGEEGGGRRGGKRPDQAAFRPVVRDSRRGQVAEFFRGGPRSVMQAQMDLKMTRSGVLSHLHGLWTFHGLGYGTQDDRAWLELPAGVKDIFAPSPFVENVTQALETSSAPARLAAVRPPAAGKPVIPEKLRPFKAESQRGRVFSAFEQPASVASVAVALGLKEGAVKSHLHSMNSDSGVGYEVLPDGRVRVLVPDGWRPF